MQKIANFEKVSFEEFSKTVKDIVDTHVSGCNISLGEYTIEEIYDNIKLPQRATAGSAGYDFFNPFEDCKITGENIIIPTGIKCRIEPGWVLMLYPRSSYGINHDFMLTNTVGIIDSDYYNNKRNEGHIMVGCKLNNTEKHTLTISHQFRFCQGIFLPFGITEDDICLSDNRCGGFGSSGK